MGAYDGEKTLLGKLVTWFFVALLVIAALKLAFWVVGVAFGIGAMILWLLLRIAPILFVGWLAIKLYRWLTRPSSDYPVR